MPVVVLLVIIAVVVVLTTLAARHNEVFFVSIRGARLLVIRGELPGSLRRDFADVVSDVGLRRGSIRAVRTETHTRLLITGADEGTAQRLRNVFGLCPRSRLRLRAAPESSDEHRNLGQILGWVWLAWLLLPRR